MIFVDANLLIYALVQQDSAETKRFGEISHQLLRRAARGEILITTSDAVLAEVAFILTAKTQANLPVPRVSSSLYGIVQLPGFRHREKPAILRALEIWSDRPSIGFVDALTAAYAQGPGIRLATFDSDFNALPGIDRWQPGESD